MLNHTHSVADIESFITMLRAACDDPVMNRTLAKLLAQPAGERQELVNWLVTDMQNRGAPKALVMAVACLADEAIADRARAVISACPTMPGASRKTH